MKLIIRSRFFIMLMLSLVLAGCGSAHSEDNNNGTSIGNKSDTPSVPVEQLRFLFAHGYDDSSSVWTSYLTYIRRNEPSHKLFYTDVAPKEHIALRAKQLAMYINKHSTEIPDHSLVAVGYSMGGLDLRYIIAQGHLNPEGNNSFYRAAKKIYLVYTLSTPHKGIELAKFGNNNATDDMTIENMKKFNHDYPYTTFSIDHRSIAMLAMRFHCDEETDDAPSNATGTDGVVKTKNQILDGAPYTRAIYHDQHSTTSTCSLSFNPPTPILQDTKNIERIVRDVTGDDPIASAVAPRNASKQISGF